MDKYRSLERGFGSLTGHGVLPNTLTPAVTKTGTFSAAPLPATMSSVFGVPATRFTHRLALVVFADRRVEPATRFRSHVRVSSSAPASRVVAQARAPVP